MRFVALVPAVVVSAVVMANAMPATSSSFTDTTASGGNTVTAIPDWTPPAVSDVVVQKSEGGVTGKLRPGGSFYVYANATDSGNPASGVAALTADVGGLATVASAPLTAGRWTVGGTTYAYRSAPLEARSELSAGDVAYGTTATDRAGNGPASTSQELRVETSGFRAYDFTTTDRSGNSGLAQAGDELGFVFERAPEPGSIMTGWDGASVGIDVVLVDGGLYGGSSSHDLLAVLDARDELTSLGYVALAGDYVDRRRSVTFGGSSMVLDGTTVAVTLGHASGATRDDNWSRSPNWSPTTDAYDEFGIRLSAGTVDQRGSARRQF